MSEWSGSNYEGETLDGWYHGVGKFTYPNEVVYEGQFYKGEFHGEGILKYPNGVRILRRARQLQGVVGARQDDQGRLLLPRRSEVRVQGLELLHR
mgnify:CR=1 FL=1